MTLFATFALQRMLTSKASIPLMHPVRTKCAAGSGSAVQVLHSLLLLTREWVKCRKSNFTSQDYNTVLSFILLLSHTSFFPQGKMITVETDIRDNAFLLLRCLESGRGVFDCCVARLAPSLSTVSCWREKSANDAFGESIPGPHVRRYVRLRGRNDCNACWINGATATAEGKERTCRLRSCKAVWASKMPVAALSPLSSSVCQRFIFCFLLSETQTAADTRPQ